MAVAVVVVVVVVADFIRCMKRNAYSQVIVRRSVKQDKCDASKLLPMFEKLR